MVRILVFDDDKTSAEGVRSMLSKAGFDVAVVQKTAEVPLVMDQHSFDLALIDLILKDEPSSGLDVLGYIDKNRPDTKMVLLTAGGTDRRHHISTALTLYPVCGGISKDSDIADCVGRILEGESYFDPEIEVFRPASDLDPSTELMKTPGHVAVWVALAKGHTSTLKIATETHMKHKYVRNCISQMADKVQDLGLINKEKVTLTDLAAYAATHRDFFLKWKPRGSHSKQ